MHPKACSAFRWIDTFLQKNGGIVKAVYVTYDSKDVDNVNYFQWPLGVAT